MGGGCVPKERKEIKSVTESGTEFEITLTLFLINQNFSKLQTILLMFLSFEAKKSIKKKNIWFTAGKK